MGLQQDTVKVWPTWEAGGVISQVNHTTGQGHSELGGKFTVTLTVPVRPKPVDILWHEEPTDVTRNGDGL